MEKLNCKVFVMKSILCLKDNNDIDTFNIKIMMHYVSTYGNYDSSQFKKFNDFVPVLHNQVWLSLLEQHHVNSFKEILINNLETQETLLNNFGKFN